MARKLAVIPSHTPCLGCTFSCSLKGSSNCLISDEAQLPWTVYFVFLLAKRMCAKLCHPLIQQTEVVQSAVLCQKSYSCCPLFILLPYFGSKFSNFYPALAVNFHTSHFHMDLIQRETQSGRCRYKNIFFFHSIEN